MGTSPERQSAPGDASDFQSLLLQAIYDISPDGILVVNEQGLVVSHNRPFLQLWNIAPSKLHRRDDGTMVGESDAPLLAEVVARVQNPAAFLERVRELYDNPQLDDHCEIELKDGRTLERHSTVLRDSTGRYLGRVWFFRDITAQKNHESALIQLARHDPLTGVANRRYFFERGEQEFMRSRRYHLPLSLALIDVDHFKQINDQLGHATGDEALKMLSRKFSELLRESDLIARIGGEEFAILMPSTGLAGAALMAERLRMAVTEAPTPVAGQMLNLRFSAGVTQLKAKDQSIEDCLRRADEAMYKAKQAGRDRVEACA
ncbi:MAG: sensor domain-containing diguanylate cyclase [Hylemonella sp.]|uniref:sensor domain-containing diguanylate cyclase n=1 Tax=Hylemonella sp. TaxID=2066020 RepID=UPI0022BCD063|nr:sensor domain-containing diguanylate cyclase [Hylemonella sp.]MCZ8251968.1 sensor domain-containing diguanylate cyclase [Hylemonella sp.]